ncbi:MAG: preprotein translocase subunit SecG [Candidatus Brocadiales bacterium]
MNEKTVKWLLAIIIVFGLVGTMFMLEMVSALRIFIVLTCLVMIGTILLQAGRGGGLAAIGGIQDQSAFGTRTSTFLSKLTYLIGAVFIVGTICLTKISSVALIEKAAVEQTTKMPAGHPPLEAPPGHPPVGEAPVAAPAKEKEVSPALGWQEKPKEEKPEEQGPKKGEKKESPK